MTLHDLATRFTQTPSSKLLLLLETKNPVGKLRQGLNLEVTGGIEPPKYGFANRPVSHSGTSPH
jgi:hypothetical protein